MKRILSIALILLMASNLWIPTGSAQVTAPLQTSQMAKAAVAVKTVKLNKQSLTVRIGKTATLKATVSPRNATDKKITWISSDETIATVSASGKITPLMLGTTIITAETANGQNASCAVMVRARNPSGVKLSNSSATLYTGGTLTLTPTISPDDADQALIWSSSKKNVATVSQSGEVQAIKAGTAIITAKAVNGKKATCKITVKRAPPAPIDANDMKFTLWGKQYIFPVTEDQVPLLFDVTRTYTENYIDKDDIFVYEIKHGGTTVKIFYDNYKWTGGIRPFEHVEISGNSAISYRGVKKGDSASKVKSVYGKPYNVFTNAYEYVCEYDGHHFMYFVRIKSGKVTGFMLSQVT